MTMIKHKDHEIRLMTAISSTCCSFLTVDDSFYIARRAILSVAALLIDLGIAKPKP